MKRFAFVPLAASPAGAGRAATIAGTHPPGGTQPIVARADRAQGVSGSGLARSFHGQVVGRLVEAGAR
jgi:hypothetical protein